MRAYFAILGLAAGGSLVAETAAQIIPALPEKISATNTQTMDFPAGGTLRLANGVGVLTIQGWDQPGMEITVIKSSKAPIENKEQRDRMTKLLENVKVTAERKGDEVVVSSSYPKHPKALRLFEGLTDFDLEYRIKLPVSAKLELSEDLGETNIENVKGDIHAQISMGEIHLLLADAQYSIDAKSKFGSVNSDFAGTEQRKKFVGHAFVTPASAEGQKLLLRTSYGDIVIQKKH